MKDIKMSEFDLEGELKKAREEALQPPEMAPIWKPKVNDRLFGTVKAIKPVTTQFGDQRIITITETTGEDVALWLTKGLERFEGADKPLSAGNTVCIEYMGFTTTKNGNMHTYAVAKVPLDIIHHTVKEEPEEEVQDDGETNAEPGEAAGQASEQAGKAGKGKSK